MNPQLRTDFVSTVKDCWMPPDNRPIHLWAADNVTLSSVYSIPGKFSADRSRYVIAPLESLSNPLIRQVNSMAPPRSFKSGIAELFLLHSIVNSAGTMTWFHSSDEMMDRFAELRLMPLIKGCPPVNQLVNKRDKFAISKKRLKFPHCTVNLSSAKMKALQSLGIRFLIGDEVWQWQPGFIGQAKARTGDFADSCKIYFLSQGGEQGDDWNTEFEKAPVHEWGWLCPKCNKEQTFHWSEPRADGSKSGIQWDQKAKDANGDWDVQKAGKSAYLDCHFCRHRINDTPTERRYLNDTGRYICTQPNGNPTAISYRWNDIGNISIPWQTLVIEWLQSIRILRDSGVNLAIKEFTQKRLAQPFKKYIHHSVKDIILASYDPNETWGDFKFMTVDVQKNKVLPYVIRVWMKSGEGRKIKHGVALGFEELNEIKTKYGVRDHSVFLDCGDRQTEVFAECVKHSKTVGTQIEGWIALKGDGRMSFKHPDNTYKLWHPELRGDPNQGLGKTGDTCPLYYWSNKGIKDILMHLRDGKGTPWLSNEDDPEYTKQLNSEYLDDVKNKQTGKVTERWVKKPGVENHWLDCEAMQIVACCLVGLLGNISATNDSVLDKPHAIEGET